MNELAKDVADFPYTEVRPLQDQFIKTIFSAVEEGCSAAIEGSNGLGKTIAALSACLQKAFEKARAEPKKPLFCEHRGMSSKENERMVDEFKGCAQRGGAALLGVLGGRSLEGVDFPGDEMNSVVIVGVPYAEPTPKVKAQISYFEECYPGLGREYGYVIPAMKKASQAAGRPIRTLEDKAAMIFLDYRFSTPYCRQFFPL
jgi:DNA excision repair protein ERCC-2